MGAPQKAERLAFVRRSLYAEERRGEVCIQLHHSVDPGDVVDLQKLSPITHALASYRNDVGNRYDLRVLSFDVCVQAGNCRFEVANVGKMDGRHLSPCVQIDDKETCGKPMMKGTKFPKEIAAAIQECLKNP